MLKKRRVLIFIVGSWLLGVLIFVPHYFNFRMDKSSRLCVAENGEFYRTSTKIQSVTIYLMPAFILMVNFVRTIIALWKRNVLERSFAAENRKRLTYLLLGLIGAYFIFSTPLVIYMMLRGANYHRFSTYEVRSKVYRPVVLVALLTIVSDPIFQLFYSEI